MYSNKNILFSTDGILGYKESVQKELEKRFQYVEYIEKDIHQDCKKDIFYKILRESSKKLSENSILKKVYRKYQKKYIDKLMDNFTKKFDYFFVIAGQEFSKEFIKELRKRNQGIKCIFFLWDSLDKTALKNSAFEYDYIFSFDKEDCKKYNFIFRESFYIEEYQRNVPKYNEKKYDIYYLGALRDKERYDIVKEFKKYAQKYNLTTFFRVVYNKKTIKILSKEKLEDFLSTQKIDYQKNREILKNSKVVLDLSTKGQNGLTLRVPESIAAGVKIITNNEDIKNYDFYNEKNIKIIKKIKDIEKIEIEFFKEPFVKIEQEIKERYSTEGFIDEILNKINFYEKKQEKI